MENSINLQKLISQLKNDQKSWSFFLEASAERENLQFDKPRDWRYTRAGFLFAWCVENKAFKEKSSEGYKSAEEEVFRKKIPTKILMSEDVNFTPAILFEKFSDFLVNYYYPGWICNYLVDYDVTFISKENISDLLVEPSWDNYLKIKNTIDLRFGVWVGGV